MDNSEQPGEKIVQYLDGEMTGQELRNFESELAVNPALQAELDNLGLAHTAVMHYGLKQQVAAVHQTMMAELRNESATQGRGKVVPLFRTVLKIAAALFIGGLLYGAYQYTTTTPAGFAKDNYQPYTISAERGETSKSTVETAYINNDYKGTIAAFEKTTTPTVKEQFLAAQAYLGNHQPAKAIKAFIAVLANQGAAYKDDAEYYLADAYIQNGQPSKAKPLLVKIHNDTDHLYHSKVTRWTLVKVDILIFKSGN
ncbi:tetratricopeptide repeat protein [Mucilaginibacter flavidus]|uniref:tetratricopeptide repeat protein n=1 Tax=Mucilaginibacter flavidus TaxID=2949309 RepID=UPI0020927CFB|nr:tetratricopeptide repeat protein [Mucilaginibacter flavidus]MCO5947365.1 tetratricopeptide repeat protein [Mucilaginibacter flavidus]